jgi:hypothetical protein
MCGEGVGKGGRQEERGRETGVGEKGGWEKRKRKRRGKREGWERKRRDRKRKRGWRKNMK